MPRMLEGPMKRLSAYVGEDEMYEDRALWKALVDQARILGCAGATVIKCVDGYGAASREVAKHGLRMSSDRPVMVQVVDEGAPITALAEVWCTMMPSGMVTTEDVCVVHYKGNHEKG